MKNEKSIISVINEDDYGAILSQAIHQIRAARIVIAKQINSTTQSAYWNVGKLLFEKKLSKDMAVAL